MEKKVQSSALLGAAFLMATSAIGPGFLTQTTVFTQQMLASFGFVILISILLDIGAQLNIWRVIVASELRAQDLANMLLPGLGYLLTILILIGGLAFNIGNIAGCGLGLQVLTGLDVATGAAISCVVALAIFWVKEAGKLMDNFAKFLGFIMIGLTIYVVVSSHPPYGEALVKTFIPEKINAMSIITLVGGTVGGYISFAGAHRLIDANVKGVAAVPQASRSSVTAILLASTMRILLFLAALGVVVKGVSIDPSNPPASIFRIAAGDLGYRIFGVIMWSAAITSVVGSAYTSVSFLRTLHSTMEKNYRFLITGFIVFSTCFFLFIGKPVKVLIMVGTLNGFILPIALTVILIAATKHKLVNHYKHPKWMSVIGWMVVAAMLFVGVKSFL
ncbi:NRAMP family divalent metal transporter [Solitalea koreensis]|uniref:Mn2+ and Fe2+ transporters of the NRAMP family n=1 Tax=Solitalea koreensis TaxID=543615 RepID=A0A521BZI8_9SPHI|nr:NRAMP family divalent metal transporter [Solitalea koreensis]SMO52564.1 Mn2+ and Fe2+ transporters of the NRAMP family [Solitalea koreensis]